MDVCDRGSHGKLGKIRVKHKMDFTGLDDLKAIVNLCHKNDFMWAVEQRAFSLTVGLNGECIPNYGTSIGVVDLKPGFIVIDKKRRGFLMVMPNNNNVFELHCALVDASHRRKGILRAMVKHACKKLPFGSILWLECKQNVIECWKKLGFVPSNRVIHPGFSPNTPFEFEKAIEQPP